jgi:hypothetical protein
MITLLELLGISQKQALELISEMEKISETLNTAITDDTKSSPTPAEKANAITGCQTTAAQLRHIAANIAKH